MTRAFSTSETWLTAAAIAAMLLISGCAGDRGPTVKPLPLSAFEPATAIRPATRMPTNDTRIMRLPSVSALAKTDRDGAVRLVSYDEPSADGKSAVTVAPAPLQLPTPEGDTPLIDGKAYPIDLANALALGGANNLQIQLARERVLEAQADWYEAKLALLPNLTGGIGYNKHDGRIQSTLGPVVKAPRNSLFVGGGAGLNGASLAGGSGGPSQLALNLSLADAYFEPLAAAQVVDARGAAEAATMNEMLMEIGRAYFALVGSHAMLANANDALASSKKMVKLATDFADAGAGARAEVYRAETELAHWQRAVHAAEREIGTNGAELARLLQMSHNVRLVPVDPQIAPVELLDESTPVSQLIETALISRPELAEHQSLVEAAIWRMRQECVRPWLPMIQLGASAGSFGGGAGTAFAADGSRSDVDLLAVWELKNLGLGHRALKSRRSSQLRQAEIEAEEVQNLIVSQVVKAATAVAGYRREINAARKGLVAAKKSYVANLARIREGEGQPLEMLQAARARANAQNALTEAITEYNRAQMSLLRALGQPPGAPAE